MVGSIGAPLAARVNIEVSNLQAVAKSGERKNTQVTFTKKNVSSARKKFWAALVRKNAGANDAEAVTTGTGSAAGTTSGDGETSEDSFFGRNNLSMQR